MPHSILIQDCMHRSPLTIDSNSNLVQAIDIILEHKLTGLTVTDSEGFVVGVLSELDCLKAVLTEVYNEGDPERALVSDAMTTGPDVCSPHDGIVEVAQAMLESKQRRRPVIEDGKLIGQVSSSNVLWSLMEHTRRKKFDARK